MSSCQSFLRQRVTGSTILLTTSVNYYVFVAGAGNYVGNYPPGYMVASTPIVPTGAVLRDMGKTIQAGVSADNGSTVGAPGFFRAVQIITPVVVPSATSSTTFGVGAGMNGTGLPGQLPSGGNAGDDGYNTYYIPISVGGVVAATSGSNSNPLTVSVAGIRVGEQL